MEPLVAQTLAIDLMTQHGLISRGWNFKWDYAKKRAGRCCYGPRTISLSKPVVEVRDEASVRNTILHEIAHALVRIERPLERHGHDDVWRRRAQSIGCTGERCTSGPMPEGNYIGVCPHCGEKFNFHRKPRAMRVYWCNKCLRANGGHRNTKTLMIVSRSTYKAVYEKRPGFMEAAAELIQSYGVGGNNVHQS